MVTFSSLCAACERAGDARRAAGVLDAMHAAGLAGPQQLYNGVIAAAGARAPELALEVWLGMQAAGAEPGVQTANILMAALAGGGRRDDALWLLRAADAQGWPLSHTAAAALLRLLAERGEAAAADAVAARMGGAGPGLDGLAAGLVLAAHARAGDAAGAARLAAEFAAAGVKLAEGLGRRGCADGAPDGGADGRDGGDASVPEDGGARDGAAATNGATNGHARSAATDGLGKKAGPARAAREAPPWPAPAAAAAAAARDGGSAN